MKPSTTELNDLRTQTLKAKALIRTEARDLRAKAHDLSGLKPRMPELMPGVFLVALGPSGAPFGASWASLGGVLGSPEAAAGGPWGGPGRVLGPLGGL